MSFDNTDQYIQPITKIYNSFNELNEDADKDGYSLFFEDRILEVVDLAQGRRNLIVGEPGIGKTQLLKKIQKFHVDTGDKACFISLRSVNPIEQIDVFLEEESDNKKILLLDALDEVKSNIFPEVLQKIETISKDHPDLIIYLSSRLVFIRKYSISFPEYRFIKVLPFSTAQVRNYLMKTGNKESVVDPLIAQVMQFSHGRLVLQTPRYLSYLVAFIKNKNIDNVFQVSRSSLFEYFIDSKLEIEDKKLNIDLKAVTKRVLEKLALTMEIFQTNTIKKDELMTFFDDIQSDLNIPSCLETY